MEESPLFASEPDAMLVAALRYCGAGLSVLPITPRTKRPPTKSDPEWNGQFYLWEQFAEQAATGEMIYEFMQLYPSCWIGIAAGNGSGGLEVMDFDIPGKHAPGAAKECPAWEPWREAMIQQGHSDLLLRLVIGTTPSGGRHLFYRCSNAGRSQKLARVPGEDPKKPETLIETKGQKGQVVCAPSPGYSIIQGKLEEIPTITPDERDAMLAIARTFDEIQEVKHVGPTRNPATATGERPGDEFEARATWEDILEPHDWRKVRRYGNLTLWVRPGKQAKDGWSARTGEGTAGDRFVTWSTSTPFPSERALTKFHVYTVLNFGSDPDAYARAAKKLASEGYGTTQEKRSGSTTIDGEEGSKGPVKFLPNILVSDRELRDQTDDALGAIELANDPPRLFMRDGLFTWIKKNEEGDSELRNLAPYEMRRLLARVADWVKYNEKRKVEEHVSPPMDVVHDVLSFQDAPEGIPPLHGMSACPIMAPSGRFRREYGYDSESRWFVTNRVDWPVFDGSGPQAAAWVNEELFGDFPFEDQASRANAMALFILPYVRPLITGNTPLHMVDAPTPGTGKGMLLKSALWAALGKEPPASAIPEKEEELAKLLFSLVRSGSQVVVLDNLDRMLKSGSLAMALTTGEMQGRILGVSETPTLKVRSVFALTSNNGKLSIDIARRTVWIRLNAQSEDPEKRRGFRHPNLMRWVREHRGQLVAAAMAMCEHWDREGRPGSERHKGSYDEWSDVVGGIIGCCGISGFIENDRELKDQANPDESRWKMFYEQWNEKHGSNTVLANELFSLANDMDDMIPLLGDGNERSRQTRFGRALGQQIGRVRNGLQAQTSTMSRGMARFKLVEVVDLVNMNPPPTRVDTRDAHAHTHAQAGGECESTTPPFEPTLPLTDVQTSTTAEGAEADIVAEEEL
jgi:hypothetical protein